MSATSRVATGQTSQDVCIDLPGESVQCWRSSDNIKVVLRKHRDVIFDINLRAGNIYTIESTESDFYNARDKKLVQGTRHGLVTFNDGERLHLWVTRQFKGALLLKAGSTLLMKLVPNELDSRQYDNSPKTKPLPIVVAIGSKRSETSGGPNGKKPAGVAYSLPIPAAAPADEDLSLVCVVEGTVKNMPEVVAQHFSKGGGKSGIADIDPFEVATRNWIWGQAASTTAFVKDNWTWLKASLEGDMSKGFRLVSAKVHLVNGKIRFYFSGFSRQNVLFGQGGFGPAHDRVMSIFGGAGKMSTTLGAAAKASLATFKGSAFVSFIFGSAAAAAEWKDDVTKDGYDLAAALFVSVVKALIGAALTALAVALFVAVIMIVGGASLSVLAVGGLTVVVGLGANWIVEAVDKSLGKAITGDPKMSDGTAGPFAATLRKAGTILQQNWNELVIKFPADYFPGMPL